MSAEDFNAIIASSNTAIAVKRNTRVFDEFKRAAAELVATGTTDVNVAAWHVDEREYFAGAMKRIDGATRVQRPHTAVCETHDACVCRNDDLWTYQIQ